MTISERLFVWLQYLIPQHTVSAIVNAATRWRWRPWKNWLIRAAVARFGIDLSEAADPSAEAYDSFNQFFTRPLAEGARPIAAENEALLVSPADGTLSQLGDIRAERVFQAKGQSFTLLELLTDALPWQAHRGGLFATIYLSPRDYHRVHMPVSGRLLHTVYVPGRLFSVAPVTTRQIPRLFARNERFISWFETELGPLAVVLVGAVCVSAMETSWSGAVAPGRQIRRADHQREDIQLARGAELGRFNMGSTVILTLPAGALAWKKNLSEGVCVRMGEALGLAIDKAPGNPPGDRS